MSLEKDDFKFLVKHSGVQLSTKAQNQVENTYNTVDWSRLPIGDVTTLHSFFIKYLNGKKDDRHINQELSELIFEDMHEKK